MKKKTLINKADVLFRKIIRERDNVCQYCHQPSKKLDVHHIIGRRLKRLRWDERNAILLCSGCHTMRTDSAHQNPLKFNEWFRAHVGEKIYWELIQESNRCDKLPYDWVEGEYEKLKEMEGICQ